MSLITHRHCLGCSHPSITSPRAPSPKKRLPLTGRAKEMKELRTAIKELQVEAHEQLELEQQSQATFEYLNKQIKSLRNAFNSLSDIVQEEIENLRTESVQRMQTFERVVDKQDETLQLIQAELANLRVEVRQNVKVKEKQFQKDSETLRAQIHSCEERIQQMDRDMIEFRQETIRWRDVPTDIPPHREQQLMALQQEVMRVEEEVSRKQRADLVTMDHMKSEIQKLIEAASLHQQQSLKSFRDVSVSYMTLEDKIKKLDSVSSRCDLSVNGLREMIAEHEQETRRRFEEISRVFKVFARTLNMPSTPGHSAGSSF